MSEKNKTSKLVSLILSIVIVLGGIGFSLVKGPLTITNLLQGCFASILLVGTIGVVYLAIQYILNE